MGWNFDEIRIIRKIRCWSLEKWNHSLEVVFKKLISIFNVVPFKQGDVFLRKNTVHSFENALLGGCHFSRVARIGLMSVARFSWVPNLYNIHFLVENHRPQPDPVNCHPVQFIYCHIMSYHVITYVYHVSNM